MALPNLPNETLLQIFCELDYEDLFNLSYISHQFHGLYLRHKDYIFEKTASASLKAVLQSLNTPSQHLIARARYFDAIINQFLERYYQKQKEQNHGIRPLEAKESKNVRETVYRLRHYMLLDGFARVEIKPAKAYRFVPLHDENDVPIKWIHRRHDSAMSSTLLDLATHAQAAHVAAMAFQCPGEITHLIGTEYQDLNVILNWAIRSFSYRLIVIRVDDYDLPIEDYELPYIADLSPFLEGWERELRSKWQEEKLLSQDGNMQVDG